MTVTYNLATTVGQIRLKISDTTLTDPVFTDEELTYFYTEQGSIILLASAAALEAWATKYAANADSEHIGDYSYTQSIIKNLLAMAQNLRATYADELILAINVPVLDTGAFNLTGVEDFDDEL